MNLRTIVQPAQEPLPLTEAKLHLKIDEDNHDPLISSLIIQAREWCEGYQKKKYITQTLELILDKFPSERYIEFLGCSPVQSVTSIAYFDETGTQNTMDVASCILDDTSLVNKLVLKTGKSWPTVTLQSVNGVKIQFIAGYGDNTKVPESVKWAMVMHMKTLYDDMAPEERNRLEKARDALLDMNRVVNV